MPEPQFISPAEAARLKERPDVWFDFENKILRLGGRIYSFSDGQAWCFRPLWDNVFRGNSPMLQGRLLSGWPGKTSKVADLFKRQPAWKNVIVGDGRGRLWVQIPKEFLR